MRCVVAASTERVVAACRDVLGDVPGTEFRVGSVPETAAGCDAAILSFPLAHERYGGTPRIGIAQVLVNTRGDGAPEIILATPPGPVPTPMDGTGGDADVEGHVVHVLSSCVAEFDRSFPERGATARVLVHLEAAGIDRRDLGAPLRGMRRFLSEVARPRP